MAETQSTVPTTTEATAPTGDIKVFIDTFNKDFDAELKKLVDTQQNYKNVYADAIKISTPKSGPWPNDPKVVTIGDLFKYTFPDIESDKFVQPPDATMPEGDIWENYKGTYSSFAKTLDGAVWFAKNMTQPGDQLHIIIKQTSEYLDIYQYFDDNKQYYEDFRDYSLIYSEVKKTEECVATLDPNFQIEKIFIA